MTWKKVERWPGKIKCYYCLQGEYWLCLSWNFSENSWKILTREVGRTDGQRVFFIKMITTAKTPCARKGTDSSGDVMYLLGKVKRITRIWFYGSVFGIFKCNKPLIVTPEVATLNCRPGCCVNCLVIMAITFWWRLLALKIVTIFLETSHSVLSPCRLSVDKGSGKTLINYPILTSLGKHQVSDIYVLWDRMYLSLMVNPFQTGAMCHQSWPLMGDCILSRHVDKI